MNFPARIDRLKGKGIVTAAAKHNLRKIAAEIGVDKRIDPARMHMNYILRGPDNVEGVAALRADMLKRAGIKKLRTDAVQALEVIFTWPFPEEDAPRQYFEDCTQWAEKHFQVPVLSSIVHLDESEPHCHMLMLPLVNGRMNGSDLFGMGARLSMHLNSYYKDVGAKYGIVRPVKLPKLTLAERDFVITKAKSVLDVMSGLTEETINVLLAAHRKQPHTLMEHFKIVLPPRVAAKTRSFVEMMTRKVKPEQPIFPFTGVVA
jgi:hypothetical protein